MLMGVERELGVLLGEVKAGGLALEAGRGIALVGALRGRVVGMTQDRVLLGNVDRLAGGVVGLVGNVGSEYWGVWWFRCAIGCWSILGGVVEGIGGLWGRFGR